MSLTRSRRSAWLALLASVLAVCMAVTRSIHQCVRPRITRQGWAFRVRARLASKQTERQGARRAEMQWPYLLESSVDEKVSEKRQKNG